MGVSPRPDADRRRLAYITAISGHIHSPHRRRSELPYSPVLQYHSLQHQSSSSSISVLDTDITMDIDISVDMGINMDINRGINMNMHGRGQLSEALGGGKKERKRKGKRGGGEKRGGGGTRARGRPAGVVGAAAAETACRYAGSRGRRRRCATQCTAGRAPRRPRPRPSPRRAQAQR